MKSLGPNTQLHEDRKATSVWQPNGIEKCFRINGKNPPRYVMLQFTKALC